MIGRKISDQTITCKVIKPMVINTNTKSNGDIMKSQSPLKQGSKFVSMNFEPIQQSQGRVFGMNNNQVEVDIDVGLEYENQFNRLNYYEKERNCLRSQKEKEIMKNDFSNVGSRNVTHFFINHKEKPINVEVVKKTNQITKNASNTAGSSEIKKYSETPKTEDVSFKAAKDEKVTEIDKKKSENIIKMNKSGLIDNKVVTNKSGVVEKSGARVSNLPTKQRSVSKYQAKVNNQKSTTQLNKQISKKTQPHSNQQSKQKLFLNQNSSKLITSHSKDKLPIKKQPVPNANKKQQTSVKRPTEKSAKKDDRSLQNQRSSLSIRKNESFKISEREIKHEEISLKPWQEISEESSVCIENYEPNNLNDIEKDEEEVQIHMQAQKDRTIDQIKVQNQIKPRNHINQSINQSQPNKRPASQKAAIISSKPAQKRYMSVKEQIQQKLKEKRLKQQQFQLRKREIQEQRRQQEKELEVQNNNKDSDCSQEYEEEQQRADIPEPIFILPEQKAITQPKNESQQIKPETCQMIDLDDTDKLKNSQLIYNEIMADLQQNHLPENQSNQIKYNYIESSDQEQGNQNEKKFDEQELQGVSEMVWYSKDSNQQISDRLKNFKKFQDDLQQELSFRHLNMYQTEQEAELFEDQQIQMINQREIVKFDIKKGNEQHKTRQLKQETKIKKHLPSLPTKNTQKQLKKLPPRQNESEEQSQEQQQEETNPKLLQYLKQRNLISSNKPNPPKNQRISSTVSPNNNKVKITQILNGHNQFPANHQRQVIIEVEEEYLQSSIVVSQRNEISQMEVDSFQQDDSMRVELPNHIMMGQQFQQNSNRLAICDSSDSQQQGYKELPSGPSQFVSLTNPSTNFDQLFDLNLQSLLKKQFIQLQ